MILITLLLIPLAAGLIGWLMARSSPLWPRLLSLAAMAADLVLLVLFWIGAAAAAPPPAAASSAWLAEVSLPWIPSVGIRFHLAMDGLSLLMTLLTAFLGVVSVLASWREVRERTGFFHLNLMLVLTGILGVFWAVDLILFYVFWEIMLIPMFFLIDLWGHEDRTRAAVKFFLFTQLSGLLMLLAILGLYFLHGRATGTFTFDLVELLGTPLPLPAATLLLLGFFAAFAVKLPVVPLHTWLPDAHTQAPTAGSVILAGLMLKTGAYGLIRFAVPLFPQAASWLTPAILVLAVVGILYGAFQAFGQRDLKRLIAYTSVSHLGFVLLGIFAGTRLAYQGAVLEMICHGLSTGALFMLAGSIQERLHTRDLSRMGGFWETAPSMGAMMMLFALASLGLPGLGNFVAEILVFLGTFPASRWAAVLAVAGLVAATVYAVVMVQRTFFGPRPQRVALADLVPREWVITAAMGAVLLWLGLFPQPVLDASTWLRGLPPPAALSSAAPPPVQASPAGGAP